MPLLADKHQPSVRAFCGNYILMNISQENNTFMRKIGFTHYDA